MRTRVKICGITSRDAAHAAIDAGADAIGLVFVRSSPRFIEPGEAWALVSSLPPFITTVGLFKDASLDEFAGIEQRCPTALAQLHGEEPEEIVRACGPGVVKAIHYRPDTIRDQLRRWGAIEEVDAILVDGSPGGEGTTLDWADLRRALDDARPAKPIVLAGGLTPDNVAGAIAAVRPYAVDVSSGVERERGVKDPGLIRAFCEAVHRAGRFV